LKSSIMTRVYWPCYKWPGRTFNFTLIEILKRIARSGYEAVDLCEYPLEFWPLTMTKCEMKKLKDTLESLNLKASGITIPTFSPGLELIPIEDDRKIILKRIERAIDLVYYLEGRTVMYGICPVAIFGVSREQTYKWTLELFKKSSSLAEDRGIDIAIEFVNRAFPTSDSILQFLNEVGSKHVGLCLEVGNINARPKDETLEEHIEACKEWIKLVHLVDPVNDEWLRRIGVNMKWVIRKLKTINYDGYLVTEAFAREIACNKLDSEIAKSANYLKELIHQA